MVEIFKWEDTVEKRHRVLGMFSKSKAFHTRKYNWYKLMRMRTICDTTS